MSYKLELTTQAEEDLEAHIKAGNKLLLNKIYRLFEELSQHPHIGVGKPKQLRYESGELWSRRIDGKHRMVYAIRKQTVTVFVFSLWGHYDH